MEQLRKAFQKHDTLGDGRCDPSQFRNVLSAFGVTNGVNNVVKRFTSDGRVDYREFLDYFDKSRKEKASSSPKQTTIASNQPNSNVLSSPRSLTNTPNKKENNPGLLEIKLFNFRKTIEKELKKLDQQNSGLVAKDSFVHVLGKCGFDNTEAINTIVGSVGSGEHVNYELFLSLIGPNEQRSAMSLPQRGIRGDRKVFHELNASFYDQLKNKDPLSCGLIEENQFKKVIVSHFPSNYLPSLNERIKECTSGGKVDYNQFVMKILEDKRLENSEYSPRGIKTYPYKTSEILDAELNPDAKPKFEGSLATFPKRDSVGDILSFTPEHTNEERPLKRYVSPTFKSDFTLSVASQENDSSKILTTPLKSPLLQFSEYEKEEKKYGKKISPHKESTIERTPSKKHFQNTVINASDDNPLCNPKSDSSYAQLQEMKRKNHELREAINKVRTELNRNKILKNQISDTLDNCGEISSSEMKNMILKAGIGLSEEQVNYVINKCDHNKDGFIDYYDYNTLTAGVGESAFETNLQNNGLLKEEAVERSQKPKKQFPNAPTFKHQIQVGFRKENTPLPNQKLADISAEKTLQPSQVQTQDVAEDDERAEVVPEPSTIIDEAQQMVEDGTSFTLSDTTSEANTSVVPSSSIASSKQLQHSTKSNYRLLAFHVADKLKSSAPSMQKAFKSFLLDKDGTISQKEFLNGLTKMGISISPEEVDSLMKNITQDKKLNYTNFAKLIDSSYWGYSKHQDSVDEPSPRRVSKEEEIINRRIRSELVDSTGMNPVQIRESLRSVDNDKQMSLPPERFKIALKLINPSLPDWIVDRAVRKSALDNGRCDYNKFLCDLGFKLPDDNNVFTQQVVKKQDVFNVENQKELLDLGALNRSCYDLDDCSTCQTPRKDEQTLEKSMGKKKTILLNSSISNLLENENTASPTTFTPKGVRYSSTPPSRNPLFGEDISSSGIKVGYSSKPKEESMSSKKVFEKEYNLSSGIGTFVNELPEVQSPRKMLNLQLSSTFDLSGQQPSTQTTKKSAKKLYSQKHNTEISIVSKEPQSPRAKQTQKQKIDTKELLFSKMEEHHKSAKDAFRKMDAYSRGSLSIEDVQRVFKDMNVHVSKDEIKKVFNIEDNRNAEPINFTQFAATFKPAENVAKEDPHPPSPRGKVAKHNQSSLDYLLKGEGKTLTQDASRGRSNSVPNRRDMFRSLSGNIISWQE
ncbi:hypothetical protein C9374_001713 [Naegleria lovaniensis]|uniref:EF-hand domain-containing protein n=1 Tax=Naegleria lovaniensis TaxID=51637 RepID=A0AA88GWU5_NAELO|nr:uncharacterized protein C9374_001713 [Naegleria lovaniensis]KAG2387381.1 hypothetical protein C9374_001713 [Naegleria lovaniensis]